MAATTALAAVLLAGCSATEAPLVTTLPDLSTTATTISSSSSTAPSTDLSTSSSEVSVSPETTAAIARAGTEPLFPAGLTPEEEVQAQAALDVSIASSEQVDAILQDPAAKDFWVDDLKLYMGALATDLTLGQFERYLSAGVHETGATVRRYWVSQFTAGRVEIAQCVDIRAVHVYTADGQDVTSLPEYAAQPYLSYDIVEFDPPSQRWYVTDFHKDDPVKSC